MIGMIARALPYLVAIGWYVWSLFSAYEYGASQATNKHQAELDRINAVSHEAVRIATEKLRKQEQRHAEQMAALDAKHHKELQDEIISKERAIADFRADVIRVRDEFTCAGSAAAGTGKVGTSASVGHAAGAGGLQAAHVEFLLREAGRADEAVRQLQACQAIVAGDRQ